MNPSDLDLLIPATADTPGLTHHWATVTATDPLRVRLDGDAAALPVTPVDLVGNLRSGDRVRVALDAGQVFLTGRLGGAAGTSIALDSLFVAGTPSGNPTVYRNYLGEVSIDGGWLMAAGTSPVTPAIAYNTGTTLLTLPAGFRPSKTLVFPSGAYGSIVQIVADVRVYPSGNVSVFANNGGSGTTSAVFALTGIRFRAA